MRLSEGVSADFEFFMPGDLALLVLMLLKGKFAVGRAFLHAMGFTHRTVQVQNQFPHHSMAHPQPFAALLDLAQPFAYRALVYIADFHL